MIKANIYYIAKQVQHSDNDTFYIIKLKNYRGYILVYDKEYLQDRLNNGYVLVVKYNKYKNKTIRKIYNELYVMIERTDNNENI
jgi:hypothetical protein